MRWEYHHWATQRSNTAQKKEQMIYRRGMIVVPKLLYQEQMPKKVCVGSSPASMAFHKPPPLLWIIKHVSEDVSRNVNSCSIWMRLTVGMTHVSQPALSKASLCVPGSVGSDHRGEPAGDTGSDQRCACALEVWQIRPGGLHTHTHYSSSYYGTVVTDPPLILVLPPPSCPSAGVGSLADVHPDL